MADVVLIYQLVVALGLLQRSLDKTPMKAGAMRLEWLPRNLCPGLGGEHIVGLLMFDFTLDMPSFYLSLM